MICVSNKIYIEKKQKGFCKAENTPILHFSEKFQTLLKNSGVMDFDYQGILRRIKPKYQNYLLET